MLLTKKLKKLKVLKITLKIKVINIIINIWLITLCKSAKIYVNQKKRIKLTFFKKVENIFKIWFN